MEKERIRRIRIPTQSPAGMVLLLLLLWMLCALGRAESVFADPSGTLSTSLNAAETTCTVTWSDYTMPSDGAALKLAVWSAAGGQDDIRWRNLSLSGSTYQTRFAISAHGSSGGYYAHLYLQTKSGSMVFLKGTTFNVAAASCSSVSVEDLDHTAGTCRVVIRGLTSPSGISSVQVPVWSKSSQSDIIWYTASLQSDGSWTADVDFTKHGNSSGTYHIHVYAASKNKTFDFVGNTSAVYSAVTSDPQVSATVRGNSVDLKVTGLTAASGIKKVSFAVWSRTDGQDDLIWSTASYSSGAASKTIRLKDYCDFGEYFFHVYATPNTGKQFFVGSTSFQVPYPSAESVTADTDGGSFTVTIKGISCVSGIDKVVVPIWSRSDQSDIVWYTAVRQSDGSYRIASDISKHKNNTGTYYIHVYIYDDRDSYGYHAASSSMSFIRSAGELSVQPSADLMTYHLSIPDVSVPEGYSAIQLAVWSAADGQDDLTWSTMKKSGSLWETDLALANHKYDQGKYYLHLYARQSNTTMLLIKDYSYEIRMEDRVVISKTSPSTAAAGITLRSASGVSRVLFPTWCTDYGQSDIVWYEGVRQRDGSWSVAIDTANHQDHSGSYAVHVYTVDSSGEKTFVDGSSIELAADSIGTASISSCRITGTSQVTVTASVTERGTFGLFALEAGETGIASSAVPLASFTGSGSITLTAPLQADTASSLLNKKLVIGQRHGSTYYTVSPGAYITNPEAIASNTRAFPTAATKKGLQVNTSMTEDAAELGVNHSVVNVLLNHIPAESGGISYQYNGKIWHMDMGYIYALDEIFSEQAANGSIVSAVLLMQWDSDWSNLIVPSGREEGHSFYGLNAETDEGREQLAAIFSFLANRYSTSGYNVVNWILGNEVSDYTHYNWCGSVDLNTYAGYYAHAFRLLYNSVRSQYSNARVYISLDHVWNRTRTNAFTGKEFFSAFVRALDEEGSINWNIAFHPYPAPLNSANFWKNTAGVTAGSSSAFYTMLNLSSLTDHIKNTYGSQHRFILSETGFTSYSANTTDEKLQAAAIAYGYYLAEFNDMVDSFVVHRHVDHPAEKSQSLYLGLWNTESSETDLASTKKFSWTVYKYMDTSQGASYTNFALSIIGADSWSSIVPGYTASRFS
ncbi:MAG: GBS Bsp-like repeat-containing protein [Lachnospiraceae bacterium]|nr:GBS Bsp-like repeat-containing protein [Lachnospiraceae bacterium]